LGKAPGDTEMNTTTTADVAPDAPARDDATEHARFRQQSEALAKLFRSWTEVDEAEIEEQRETLALLMKGLNEHPLSDRPRFR
jgi:hypothetical protein